MSCQSIVSTKEEVIGERALSVRKNDDLEPLLREKLFLSLHNSLGHRKTATSDATALTDTVLVAIRTASDGGAIEIADLTAVVYEILKRFDKPAAVYYQAHHPNRLQK